MKVIMPSFHMVTMTYMQTTGWLWWKKIQVIEYYLLENVWYDMATDLAAEPKMQKALNAANKKFDSLEEILNLGKYEKRRR